MNATNIKAQQSMLNLENALTRLKEALAVPQDSPLAIDGTIQRFEFTFELFWKTLKKFLAQEGIDANTPRDILRKAYSINWLDDEEAWLNMLRDRNETANIYDAEHAQEIYTNIKKNYPIMEKTFLKIKNL